MERVTTFDGATIALHSTGTGPGIVVVHGGGVTIDVYRRFAAALADRFTVHLYNRRGRGDAPARALPYTFDQEVSDLAAVLAHTGAGNVVGHSAGGLIALDAALRLPIQRLALYDAAISIDGSFPASWLPAARAAAAAGDLPLAMALTAAGINTHQAAARLPLAVRVVMCRLFLRTPIGRMMGDLLPMTLDESTLIAAADGPADRWAGVTASVLLACGGRGPRYYVTADDALAAALPNARSMQIPGSAHDGINRAPDNLVEVFAEFFATPVAPRSGEPAR
ncbi:Lysophospholipase, alpha-beta hydrolase superfamily [Asanoa hainanensis]|uniref:Lysophospholipase, alpha-beta hydrolase superfamily n=1 Tax=Asanoa hainanensis TaxID=560556 RepID=A0A239JL24_9ACTN|nr:alpha/beta hydrolase [Asanoa hainanensis]SNT06547.1 Lysophospholipase, alpha-beta hydrolase superfamily [Asanoa hainanensis]